MRVPVWTIRVQLDGGVSNSEFVLLPSLDSLTRFSESQTRQVVRFKPSKVTLNYDLAREGWAWMCPKLLLEICSGLTEQSGLTTATSNKYQLSRWSSCTDLRPVF